MNTLAAKCRRASVWIREHGLRPWARQVVRIIAAILSFLGLYELFGLRLVAGLTFVAISTALWVISIWFTVRLTTARLDRSRDNSADVKEKDLEERIAYWSQRLSADQRLFLFHVLVSPAAHISRISESVSFQGKSLEVKTTTTFIFPEDGALEVAVLPVMMQKRGVMTDGLQVTDQANIRLSTLARSDAEAILVMLVDALLPAGRSPALDNAITALRKKAIRIVRSSDPAIAYSTYGEFSSALRALRADSTIAATMDYLDSLVFKISEFYPVLAVLSPIVAIGPNQSTLEHSKVGGVGPSNELPRYVRVVTRRLDQRVFVPEDKPTGFVGKFLGFTRWMRRAIGVREPVLKLAVDGADRADSFHLEVVSPRGMVVSTTSLSDVKSGSEEGIDARRVALEPIGGQTSAHYYVQRAKNLTSYRAITTFREVAPGSIGESMISAGILCVLVFAIVLGHGGMKSELLAVLGPLVFAGVGAGSIWQGVVQTREPFGGRLLARISSIVTMSLAVSAIVFAALAYATPSDANPMRLLSTAGWHPLRWEVLVLLSVVNFVALVSAWSADVIVDMALSRDPRAGLQLDNNAQSRGVG